MAFPHRRSFFAFLSSLRWNLLGCFFLNLALLGLALFVFLRMEFALDMGSLLGGTTGNRLQTLVAKLRPQPATAWGAIPWRGSSARAAATAGCGSPSLTTTPTSSREVCRPCPPTCVAR